MEPEQLVQNALERAKALAQRVIDRIERPPVPRGEPCGRCLLAEGDSWFHNPWVDVLSVLEDRHGYEVESVARAGDTLEMIAYEPGQLDKFTRRLERLIRRGSPPEAILLSAGGNDAVRSHFAFLLEHAMSPVPGLNEGMVELLIGHRLRYAMVTLAASIGEITNALMGKPLPILAHGYGYGVADGRGFLSGIGPLPGPWLEPAFRSRGYTEPADQREAVHALIDAFNAMLADLGALDEIPHFHHVDVRPLLPDHGDYRRWWSNELHPSTAGFERVADAFQSNLNRIRAL